MTKNLLIKNKENMQIITTIKKFLRYIRSHDYRNICNFQRNINNQVLLNQNMLIAEIQDYLSNLTVDIENELALASNDPVIKNGKILQLNNVKVNKNKLLEFANIRILIHKPENNNIAARSIFNNLIIGLKHMGIAVEECGFDEDITPYLYKFNPTFLFTTDYDDFINRLNWNEINNYKKNNSLKVGLTLKGMYSKEEVEIRSKLWSNLDINFFYIWTSEEYVNNHYRLIHELGYSIFSIEFSANPLVHYPVPNLDREFDYIFLGSINEDKWNRYFTYFTKIFAMPNGIISGPGWSKLSVLDKAKTLHCDKYLYSRVKVGINLSIDTQINFPSELNERTYQLAACGIPQLIDNPKLLLKRFSKDALFIAENEKDYFELYNFILQHPEEANQRALTALFEFYEKHTIFHRVEKLINDLRTII